MIRTLYSGCILWCGLCLPMLSCTAPAVSLNVKTLYASSAFSSEQISNQQIMVLPVLTADGFSHMTSLDVDRQRQFLKKQRSDITLVGPDSFMTAFCAAHDSVSLARFLRSLYTADVLSTQTSDSAWKAMNEPLCMVFRLVNVAKIRAVDGIVKRRWTVLAELWNTRDVQTVWRVEVKGIDIGDALHLQDDELIEASINRVWESLPAYIPSIHERNW